jgi:thiol-disulfide isomerase/thioredoxin
MSTRCLPFALGKNRLLISLRVGRTPTADWLRKGNFRVRMKPVIRETLFDLVTSAFATGLFLLVVLYSTSPRGKGMETLFAGAGLLFIVAGFLRGACSQAYSGLKGIILASVFVVFFVFVRPIPGVKLVLLSMIAYGGSLAGTYIRRAWRKGVRSQAALILAAVVASIEAGAVFGAPALAKYLTTRTGNVPGPAISFVRMDGTPVDSVQLSGRVTVLYFWATWCPPCWQEFPRLEKLYERYRSDPDVVFWAVDVQGNGETRLNVESFIERGGYDIPVAFDVHGAAARLQLAVYPTLLIFDRHWHVRLVHAGFDGSEHLVNDLSKEIDSLLTK